MVGVGNVLTNGGAEAGPGGNGRTGSVTVPGWTASNGATVTAYGTGNFPSATSPGPANRGDNFFSGGNGFASSSALTQSIDLTMDATAIDAGSVVYEFSAWLGGFSGQADRAVAAVSFLDAVGDVLQTLELGPVTSTDRGGVTGLQFRSGGGAVLAGARRADVELRFSRSTGSFNDGYADEVSLSLSAPAAVPEPGSVALLGVCALGGLLVRRRSAAAPAT